MFSSLKVKSFRIYWAGMFVSLIGTWIQTTAQSWLVFELTKSAFLLGVVGFLSVIPVLFFSLFAGVLADRINKRNILIVTQIAFMILAFILAIQTQFKFITPRRIMLIALLNGLVMAFDAPSRQALVADLVGKTHLLNAVVLNSVAFNSSRIIGPALAGIFISSIGMSGCFYLNGISFFAVLIALASIKLNSGPRRNTKTVFIQDLVEGLRFIKGNKIILLLISMTGMLSLFGISYIILMPIFASDILNAGVKGLGILMSATGVGAVAGALLLARLGDFKSKGRLLMAASIIFSLCLILFSLSKIYIFSILILIFIGGSSVTASSLVNTLLQRIAPDEFRGRLMSVFMLTFAGVLPFGYLIVGSLAQLLGASFALMISGIISTLFFLVLGLFYPEIKKI